jgi:hypothetical protein
MTLAFAAVSATAAVHVSYTPPIRAAEAKAHEADPAQLLGSYRADNISGLENQIDFALSFDGFYGEADGSAAFFRLGDARFDQYDDGTAQLNGRLTNTDNPEFAYDLRISFRQTAPPDARVSDHNPAWTYYGVNPGGIEMVNTTNRFDYAHLYTPDTDAFGLFRVGAGANGFNQNLGASGTLAYDHYYEGNRYGQPGYAISSNLNMDLTPVPEPTSMLLLGLGLAGAGIYRRLKKSS